MRYLMTFSYDGHEYYGYQVQKNKRTIQGEIESKLYKICGNKEVKIYASGRTDANVHAVNQKAHMDLPHEIDEEKFRKSLNSILDKSIYVKKIEKVDDTFHARFNILKKCYVYRINIGEYNPFERNYTYQYNKNLDIPSMVKAASYLIGTYNFKSFTKSDISRENYIRTIYSIDITTINNIVELKFEGSGFLRYMVRNIVGTLIEVGENKIIPEEVKSILEKQDRRFAGKIAPAEGLYLLDVKY